MRRDGSTGQSPIEPATTAPIVHNRITSTMRRVVGGGRGTLWDRPAMPLEALH